MPKRSRTQLEQEIAELNTTNKMLTDFIEEIKNTTRNEIRPELKRLREENKTLRAALNLVDCNVKKTQVQQKQTETDLFDFLGDLPATPDLKDLNGLFGSPNNNFILYSPARKKGKTANNDKMPNLTLP